jgi:hypothetical protein
MMVRHMIGARPERVPERALNCKGCQPGDPIPADAILVNSTSEMEGTMAWQHEEPYALGEWFAALSPNDPDLEKRFRADEVLDGVWLRFIPTDVYRAVIARYRDAVPTVRARPYHDSRSALWPVFIKAVDYFEDVVFERECGLRDSCEHAWTMAWVKSLGKES